MQVMRSSFEVKKLLKSIMNIILRARIPSKLQWRRQGLGGSKQIQRSMKANQKKTKAEISASVRDQKSPSLNYWINIKKRVKRRMLISQIMQRNQDHPQGANMRIGIGKVRILMQHVYILILGRQCQCRGCLPMLI